MEASKLFQLAGLIFIVLVAFVVLGLVLNIAINLLQVGFIVAIILALYFLAERLFGKRR